MNNFFVDLFQSRALGQVFWFIWVFAVGCCLGSFLNVCIWRMPKKESVVTAQSHCPNCNHLIKWYENIPLISFLCLKAKCSECHKPITWRYFIVELITGILFIISYASILHRGLNPLYLISYGSIIMMAVASGFIDYEHRIIPNQLTYSGVVVGIVFTIYLYFFQKLPLNFIIVKFIGIVIIGLFLLGLNFFGKKLFKQDAFGLGDVKYLIALGVLSDPLVTLYALFFASTLGVIYGVYKSKRSGNSIKKTAIPFGPFLAIGSVIAILLPLSIKI